MIPQTCDTIRVYKKIMMTLSWFLCILKIFNKIDF